MRYKISLGFFLLLINEIFSYNYSMINNFLNKKNKYKFRLNRRNTILALPIIYYPLKVHAEKGIEELREEANKILEIIEAQKENFNLPDLNNNNKILKSDTINNNINKNKDIEDILINIFNNFKTNNSFESLNNLKKFCSNSNYIKNTSTEKLKNIFNDSKYAILLGKFEKFEIENYNEYNIDDFKDYEVDIDDFKGYQVDTKVFCDYKTMIYNGIQFDDMHYPKANEKETLYYVIYRWNFIKEKNEKYKLESCYLVSNK